MALASYFLNDIPDSIKYTDEINSYSEDHHIYLLNKAFFAIIKSEYQKIPQYYDKLRRKISTENKYVVERAIKFLENREVENSEEIAFLFSIGILNYNYIDKDRGKVFLNDFLHKANNIEKYSDLIKVSQKILK
jgi:uncharacterized protein (DUF2225 family)